MSHEELSPSEMSQRIKKLELETKETQEMVEVYRGKYWRLRRAAEQILNILVKELSEP